MGRGAPVGELAYAAFGGDKKIKLPKIPPFPDFPAENPAI